MKSGQIESYTDSELRKGRTKQDIFNEIVSKSDFNIHDVAETIRKVPTPEKRKKFKDLNNILALIIGVIVLSKILSVIGIFENELSGKGRQALVPIIVLLVLLYGVVKFKNNIHLAASVVMLLSFIWATIGIILVADHFNFYFISDLLITLSGSVISIYLSIKLPGDYSLDKEMHASNPNQRENIITFID